MKDQDVEVRLILDDDPLFLLLVALGVRRRNGVESANRQVGTEIS